ncbi:G-protein coupled receptor family C group 6 member A-like [Alosa sapidissima]|uniref:G-protein coupled receptor family C group 6 member A-like n=1 Tax=Alosa sapidissima TaxID=34773 RepID=UPI001C08CECB|nr:G-protein coupled receptor family C group 6 member A-like [Alosa sapidissima]
MWFHLLSLALWAALVQTDENSSQCLVHADGDIIIGMLTSAHTTVDNLQDRVRPEEFTCSNFDLLPFVRMLAAIYTIDSINDSGFLPGVRLGYTVCDPCADATKALHCVEHLLSTNGSLPVLDDYSEFRPKVKIILGERYSLLTIPVARLLSVYLFPQISTTASAVVLSDLLEFPSFFRVIPSDVHQTMALAQLISHFGWNWVVLVSMNDDYGRGVHQSFLKNVMEAGVCVAYEEVIPHYLDHEQSELRIKQVAKQIRDSPEAQVVMVILRPELVKMLFEEMIRTNSSRVWIASDAWSRSGVVSTMQDINKVGDILGLNFVTGTIDGFTDYLQKLTVRPGVKNDLIKEYNQLYSDCGPDSSEDCSKPSADHLVKNVDLPVVYGERVAVWSIAHALRELLGCNETFCPGETDFPPYKLIEKLHKVNFTLDGERKFFDKNGDFEDGYDVVMLVPDGEIRQAKVFGRFALPQEKVVITEKNITWTLTLNSTLPVSQCTPSCPNGTFKKVSNISCCYSCISCAEGTYSDSYDQDDCYMCPNGTWSLRGWSKCEPRTKKYLQWSEALPVATLVGVGLGLLLLITAFVCFTIHRHSLIIRSANYLMSCFMMVGLVVSFGSVILFMDEPSIHHCRTQQMMYALGFTLCVSCILVKAFRTFLAFMAFDPIRRDRLNKLYKPVIIMVLATSVQGFICLYWLIFDTPHVDPTPPSNQSMEHILQCSEGSKVCFVVMHSYVALLAFICFLLAFKGRRVPQDFNETGVIIFSMLIHLFVWLCFIPIYMTKNESRPIVQASAILVSNYGIIFCLFVPKGYGAIRGRHMTEEMRARLRKFSQTRNHASMDGLITEDSETDTISHRSVSFKLPILRSLESLESGFGAVSTSLASTSSQSTSPSAEDPFLNLSPTDSVFVIGVSKGPTVLDRLGMAVQQRQRRQSI